MSEKAARIEAQLQDKRDALRSNFDELEDKVKSITDWRRHFQRHPGAMTAAAIGAGALLATMIGRRRRRHGGALPPDTSATSVGSSPSEVRRQNGNTRQILAPVKDALIDVAVMRASGLLDQMLSGLQEHLKRSGTAKSKFAHSFAEHEDSKPMSSERGDAGGHPRRGDVQEIPEAADIERSARSCAPPDYPPTAAVGGNEQMPRRRAKPASS
jgi:hypothetical protein